MTILLVCALIAVIMPYVARIPAIIEMNKLGGYDNKHPRQQQTQLTGLGARALAAHQNCFESLAVFAVALAAVLGTNNVNAVTETLAMTHIVARKFITRISKNHKASSLKGCLLYSLKHLFPLMRYVNSLY